MSKKFIPKKVAAKKPSEGEAPADASEPAGEASAKKKPLKASVKIAPAKKAPAAKSAPKSSRSPKGVPFICSECYEEFILPASYSKETVTCPECQHVGKRPSGDFLDKVLLHKGNEKFAFRLNMGLAYATGLFGFILFWLLSPYSQTAIAEGMRDIVLWTVGFAFAGAGALLLWFVTRYEKNRWEVYF